METSKRKGLNKDLDNLERVLSRNPSYKDVEGENYKWTPAKIKRLWEKGLWIDEIADTLLCSIGTVTRYLAIYREKGQLKREYIGAGGNYRPKGV